MSECVVRMEIPRRCAECPNQGYALNCRIPLPHDKSALRSPSERPSWCPIICSLPEGHGRLVDADALKDYLMAEAASYDLTQGQMGILSEAIDMIDEQPTIVPADTEERMKTV